MFSIIFCLLTKRQKYFGKAKVTLFALATSLFAVYTRPKVLPFTQPHPESKVDKNTLRIEQLHLHWACTSMFPNRLVSS